MYTVWLFENSVVNTNNCTHSKCKPLKEQLMSTHLVIWRPTDRFYLHNTHRIVRNSSLTIRTLQMTIQQQDFIPQIWIFSGSFFFFCCETVFITPDDACFFIQEVCQFVTCIHNSLDLHSCSLIGSSLFLHPIHLTQD